MRFATWNVNSLRARQERVEEWLSEAAPDVVMLQETKLADDAFPALSFEALGYSCAHYGQGQWNGVAILSKVGLDDVVVNFAGHVDPDPDARIITATCGGSGEVEVSATCIQDERAAHKHLVKLWPKFKQSQASRCIKILRTRGTSNYVELLTCLQTPD